MSSSFGNDSEFAVLTNLFYHLFENSLYHLLLCFNIHAESAFILLEQPVRSNPMSSSFGNAIQDALLTLELDREFAFILVIVFLTTLLHLFASLVHSDIITVIKGPIFLESALISKETKVSFTFMIMFIKPFLFSPQTILFFLLLFIKQFIIDTK